MNILGLSAFYHDSAACLVRDGKLVAAAQEERFSRKKHDARFPRHAIGYVLGEGGVGPRDLDAVAFYDKPLTKFSRLIDTYLHLAPRGFKSFVTALPVWLRQKLWIPYDIESNLERLGFRMPSRLYFTEHHQSHAASAYYPSPFDSAAVLTMDGVGEWATATIAVGTGNRLTMRQQLAFPHSLGLLYSAFTYFTGFKVNSGEYKLMGLAPYGEPRYVDQILEHLIDLREDGSFRMNERYFDYMGGFTMTSDAFAELFGGAARKPESLITQREMDLARSIQTVTEEIVCRAARFAARTTGQRDLCLAGGVALNCVANGVLQREKVFDRLWIQPAAGDAGGAVGAALFAWYQIHDQPRKADPDDSMAGGYLGPSYSDDEVARFLDDRGLPYERAASDDERDRRVARFLADQKVVGLFMGRMEFGPRALGHRSIIGDARSPTMQSVMNLKIKFRESFRPFAPSVLEEKVKDYFNIDCESPYMLLVAPVVESLRRPDPGNRHADLTKWVSEIRSDLPAITHVDYTARLQTVSARRNPDYHAIIDAFHELTGCGVIINTSFNVRGEPIVCTPEDAYRCFMRTEMDYLVLEHCILDRKAQPAFADSENWREVYELD